ncbi:MAG: hypothetical protein GH150_04175 [Hadesarchaea archaeon]|nr:hypothetical protein [Hadesarchaea archaeon]
MGKRSHWAITFGATCILIALSLWVYGLPKTILFLVISLLLLGPFYAIRRFARASTSLSLWRGLFILFGASSLSFILFIALVILRKELGLADSPLVIMLLAYLIGVPIGAYLGDRLGKRRNYMPWCR